MLHIYLIGRVQGVGFRTWAQAQGRKHGLSGWVRNRADGSVEILAHGPPEALDAFYKCCHKGPLFARVNRIEHVRVPTHSPPTIVEGVFEIIASA